MSKIRDVSTFFSQNLNDQASLIDSAYLATVDSDYLNGIVSGINVGALTIYDSISQLPLVGVSEPSLAFVDDTNNYYVHTGVGWYTIDIINRTPTLSGPDSAQLTDSDTTISFTAVDSDTPVLTWSYLLDSIADDYVSNVVNESNGTFILTYDSTSSTTDNGIFTGRASDGVNLSTKNVTIIVPLQSLVVNYQELVDAGITSTDGQYTLFKFTNNSYTLQTSGVSNIYLSYMAVIGGGGAGATFYYGGGAGGGAVIYNPSAYITMPDDTWSFSIGAGGIGTQGLGTPAVGNPGGNTTVTGASTGLWADAKGGQGGIQGWSGGQTYTGGNYDGGSGSGGGEQINNTAPSLATYAGTVPTGFNVYRNKGGDGTGSGVGGGGGGAGGAGAAGGTGTGNGGNGYTLSAFSTLEASSGASDGGRFAAGSGGVNYNTAPGSPGLGGAGLSQGSAQAVTNATNYGSAGGSNMHTGGAGGRQDAGDGFQGAVFFRFPTARLG